MNEGTRWLVGNGANLSVWNDNWIRSTTLGVQHPNNAYMNRFPEMKVAYLILDGEWVIPSELMKLIDVNELPVLNGGEDRRIWKYTLVTSL